MSAPCIICKKSILGYLSRRSCRKTCRFLQGTRHYCVESATDPPARRRVVITGIGLVTPLGVGCEHVWKEILNGSCGVGNLPKDRFQGIPSQVAAFVPRGPKHTEFDPENYVKRSEQKSMAPAAIFAIAAADEALRDARWRPVKEHERERTGVAIGGCSVVAVQDIVDTARAFERGYNKVSPFFIPRILTNLIAGHVSIRHGFAGPNHSASTACTTGLHAVGDAFRLVKHGDADVMVCGGADASIEPVVVAGFARMRALSTLYNAEPHTASRPFDAHRDGFVIGEGAGVLVVEEYGHALRRGVPIHAEVLGYGMSADAHHVSAARPDGRGAHLCMAAAVREAGVSLEDVTHVNAHATSTPVGDLAEARAIRSLFGDFASGVAVSATKGATGHLLGAAGSVEAALAALACRDGYVPPTINLGTLEPELGARRSNFVPLVPQTWSGVEKRRVALTNSFGFGGTNASLCVAQV